MAALVSDLQWSKALPMSCPSEAETISSFLDEMDLQEAAQLACHQPVPRACISSTERRKQERAALMNGMAQLELRLESLKTKKQTVRRKLDHGVQQRLRHNAQLRHALAQEQRRAGKASIQLQWLSDPMKVALHSL